MSTFLSIAALLFSALSLLALLKGRIGFSFFLVIVATVSVKFARKFLNAYKKEKDLE